jgi:hypothetical protein
MTRASERQAWTAFIEQREAERKKKPRPKKDPQPAREELERALNSLTEERKP